MFRVGTKYKLTLKIETIGPSLKNYKDKSKADDNFTTYRGKRGFENRNISVNKNFFHQNTE